MKLKKPLLIFTVMLVSMMLFACTNACTPNDNGQDKNPKNGEIPILEPLTNYSSEVKYYNVTPVTYANTDQQVTLLQARIDERKDDEDLSVPLKIFINCEPEDIILRMGAAALSYEKMDGVVNYLAGQEKAQNLDAIVESGVWEDNDDWSFFDDWDYYDKLSDKAEDSTNTKDEDNVMRQRRKMMRQIFEIGLLGDEFARLVYEEMIYANNIMENKMYPDFTNQNASSLPSEYSYDQYVKDELSFDTLVYFKAFNDFSSQSKAKTIQLYGYYYDYNKKAYDATTEERFEKQLKYSHQKTFSDSEWFDYLQIQRDNYKNAYRYSASFYQDFYTVHFSFQELIEDYDIEVYEMAERFNFATAFQDDELKYSKEMRRGMLAGFAQQLVLTDKLYYYSQDNEAMTNYNTASRNYENVKNNPAISQSERYEKEFLFNIEQLKILDYVLDELTNSELSKVLKYQIYSYSGDMIRNIQSEKKNIILDEVEIGKLINDEYYETNKYNLEVSVGRTEALTFQLDKSYYEAAPQTQINSAESAAWDQIEEEVEEAINHDYSVYEDGKAKKEALDNMIIKKKDVNPDGTPFDPENDNSALKREEYDTNHSISKFLSQHDKVLRYAVGQVEVKLYEQPSKSLAITYTLASYGTGTYTCGNDEIGRTMPDDAVPENYNYTVDSVTFESGLSLTEGISKEEANMPTFLTKTIPSVALGNEETQDSMGGTGTKVYLRYTFEGWYIDKKLKYKINPDEKVKYDMYLYPGYTVEVSSSPFPEE